MVRPLGPQAPGQAPVRPADFAQVLELPSVGRPGYVIYAYRLWPDEGPVRLIDLLMLRNIRAPRRGIYEVQNESRVPRSRFIVSFDRDALLAELARRGG